jgi:hypothetical protein
VKVALASINSSYQVHSQVGVCVCLCLCLCVIMSSLCVYVCVYLCVRARLTYFLHLYLCVMYLYDLCCAVLRCRWR